MSSTAVANCSIDSGIPLIRIHWAVIVERYSDTIVQSYFLDQAKNFSRILLEQAGGNLFLTCGEIAPRLDSFDITLYVVFNASAGVDKYTTFFQTLAFIHQNISAGRFRVQISSAFRSAAVGYTDLFSTFTSTMTSTGTTTAACSNMVCPNNASCTDTANGPLCTCLATFILNGTKCQESSVTQLANLTAVITFATQLTSVARTIDQLAALKSCLSSQLVQTLNIPLTRLWNQEIVSVNNGFGFNFQFVITPATSLSDLTNQQLEVPLLNINVLSWRVCFPFTVSGKTTDTGLVYPTPSTTAASNALGTVQILYIVAGCVSFCLLLVVLILFRRMRQNHMEIAGFTKNVNAHGTALFGRHSSTLHSDTTSRKSMSLGRNSSGSLSRRTSTGSFASDLSKAQASGVNEWWDNENFYDPFDFQNADLDDNLGGWWVGTQAVDARPPPSKYFANYLEPEQKSPERIAFGRQSMSASSVHRRESSTSNLPGSSLSPRGNSVAFAWADVGEYDTPEYRGPRKQSSTARRPSEYTDVAPTNKVGGAAKKKVAKSMGYFVVGDDDPSEDVNPDAVGGQEIWSN